MKDIIEILSLSYPDFIKAARDLALYDVKIKNWIEQNYGKDTLNNIIQTKSYYNYLDNKTNDGTPLARFAAKRAQLFDVYSQASFALATNVGSKEAFKIMDSVSDYFKSIAHVIG